MLIKGIMVLRQRAVSKHRETREKRRETNEAMQAPLATPGAFFLLLALSPQPLSCEL
jgi:hypothetical protein